MSIRIEPPTTPTTVAGEAAEIAIIEAIGDQLKGIRTAADGWQKGLAGLLTVLTSVLFLKGVDSFTKLGKDWQLVAAVLLAIGAFAAARSGIDMLNAAFGTPLEKELDTIRQQGLYVWRFNAATAAGNSMRNGQKWFGGVLICVALTIAVTWFGAASTAAPFQVKLGNDCGELQAADNGQFKIVPDKQVAVMVTKDKLGDTRIVEKC